MTSSRQRYSYQYLEDRRIVRGVFFLNGRRIRERLCSWEEARIVGVDGKGDPTFRGGKDGRDAVFPAENTREKF